MKRNHQTDKMFANKDKNKCVLFLIVNVLHDFDIDDDDSDNDDDDDDDNYSYCVGDAINIKSPTQN